MTSVPSSLLPTSLTGWRRLLKDLGVQPNKGLGQHFLYERGVIERVIRAANLDDHGHVVEVGAGLGILTESLLDHGGKVYAVELDARLAAHLRRTFSQCENLHVIEATALEVDLGRVLPDGVGFDVVANLPYSSGTAILRRLLEQPRRPRRLTVMVQREVAERIAAEPPYMTILGIATRFYADARIAFLVPPTVFLPPPKVESAVVVLDVKPTFPLGEGERALFFKIVNAGFRQKRKQIANTLAAGLGLTKREAIDWLTGADIAPDRRPQTLALEEWVQLARRAPGSINP